MRDISAPDERCPPPQEGQPQPEPSLIILSVVRIRLKTVLKYILLPLGWLCGRPLSTPRVLLYHRVNGHRFRALGAVSRELTVPTASFERQMRHLADAGYRTLSLAEYTAVVRGERPVDRKAVLITFDDGYADNLQCAAPILRRHGFTAIVFVIADFPGTETLDHWPLADPRGLGGFMSWDEIGQWRALGLEIGSHSCTHPSLTSLDRAGLEDELGRSRDRLGQVCGAPVDALAYPLGDFDQRVQAAARAAGYQLGFTTQSGVGGPDQQLAIPRTEVSASDTDLLFRAKLAGRLDVLRLRDGQAYRFALRQMNAAIVGIARVLRKA